MRYYFISLLFIVPTWGMEQTNQLPINSSVSLEEFVDEREPLLKDSAAGLMKDDIVIPMDDLNDNFTIGMSRLPQELFWLLLFSEASSLSSQDPQYNGWDFVVSFSLVSKHFRNVIREVIPALEKGLNLSPRSTSVAVVNLLHTIWGCEKKYKQLEALGIGQSRVYDSFPRYRKTVQELNKAAFRVEYCPHFMLHKGSRRIQKLRDRYNLLVPSYSWKQRFIQPFSCVSRDPYILMAMTTGLSYLTAIGSWYIYTNHLTHNELVQDAIEKHQVDVAHANAVYAREYAKNLHYAQTDYLYSFGNRTTFIAHDYQDCFALKGMNCEAEFTILDFLDMSLHDLPRVDQPHYLERLDRFLNCAERFKASVSFPWDIRTFFYDSDLGNKYARNPDLLCRSDNQYVCNIREKSLHVFKVNEQPRICMLSFRSDSYLTGRERRWSDVEVDVFLGLGQYDPACIAKRLTPVPQVPEIPSIPEGIYGWVSVMAGAYGFVTFILFLGLFCGF